MVRLCALVWLSFWDHVVVSGKIRYLYDTLKVFVLARSFFLSTLAIVHRSLCPAYRKGPQESQLGRYKSSTAGCVVFEKINPAAVVGLPCFPCCLSDESCRINLAKKLDLEPLEGVPKDHPNALEELQGCMDSAL